MLYSGITVGIGLALQEIPVIGFLKNENSCQLSLSIPRTEKSTLPEGNLILVTVLASMHSTRILSLVERDR